MSETIKYKTCFIFHKWSNYDTPYQFRPLECDSMMWCKKRICFKCGKVEFKVIKPV